MNVIFSLRRITAPAGRRGVAARARRSRRDDDDAFPRAFNLSLEGSAVGSEYGEGFIQMRGNEDIHVSVDDLNRRLSIHGAERMRHSMKPDEAFGMIFNWDDVVVDTRHLQLAAWRTLAKSLSKPLADPPPSALCTCTKEQAIKEILQWASDSHEVEQLCDALQSELAQLLEQLSEPNQGALEWLRVLYRLQMTRASSQIWADAARSTVSPNLCGDVLSSSLDRMGVAAYFSALVSPEDGMETTAESLLCAAVKLNRPPNQCLVFSSNPAGITAAHNCTMKAVGVVGPFRGYELKQADLTCRSLSELSVYNIRRVFAMKGSEFMDPARVQPKVAGRASEHNGWHQGL